MPDGKIVFSTELDNKDLEKQLTQTKKKVASIEDTITKKNSERMPLVKQAEELELSLERAKNKLVDMQTAPSMAGKDAIKEQQAIVKELQNDYNAVQRKVMNYDDAIQKSTAELERQKDKAGELTAQIAEANAHTNMMAPAVAKAEKYMERFTKRVKGLARRVFIFTVITAALRSVKNWLGDVVKTNDEATAAIARLKGALLTLAQPLVNVIIPAFTAFVNILADAVGTVASIVSTIFGTTAEESAEAAENLYNEQEALDGVGDSAKKAGKSLANFDEINKLSGDKDKKEIKPDFSDFKSEGDKESWLTKMLGSAAEMVADALILAGIAFIAIGASMGNIGMVITGLLLIGAGLYTAGETGQLQDWAEVLGLNKAQEFVALAVILGGIALVAIGAATGNILLVISGLLLIGIAIVYAQNSGMMDDWASRLGLDKAPQYITAALLIGGFALIVIGAGTGNILMVLAGLGLLAAGIYVGAESGVLRSWAAALGLDSAFAYVAAGLQLAGIALIAIGAMRASLPIVIAGAVLLGAGIIMDAAGEETLVSWWEKLKLTTVEQWVSVAILLVGIAMVCIGAATSNILLIAGGAVLLGLGVIASVNGDHLQDWVTVLGLEKVAGYVSAAMLLIGFALVVFGIGLFNIGMIVTGAALLIGGFTIATESGTLQSWAEALHLDDVAGKVSTAIMLAGIALIGIGAATLNLPLILAGLALLGVGAIANYATGKSKSVSASVQSAQTRSVSAASVSSVPHLASGGVIPANREFLAVLGDQKSGTNVEAPLSTIEQALENVLNRRGNAGGGEQSAILELDGTAFGRLIYRLSKSEGQRIGVDIAES